MIGTFSIWTLPSRLNQWVTSTGDIYTGILMSKHNVFGCEHRNPTLQLIWVTFWWVVNPKRNYFCHRSFPVLATITVTINKPFFLHLGEKKYPIELACDKVRTSTKGVLVHLSVFGLTFYPSKCVMTCYCSVITSPWLSVNLSFSRTRNIWRHNFLPRASSTQVDELAEVG